MALLSEGEKVTTIPELEKRFDYHVAFSYCSALADADYVGRVNKALPTWVTRFNYVNDESNVTLWGRELKNELTRVYKYAAPFCVVFISKDYVEKRWTKLEWKIARRASWHKRGYVLPVILDGTRVPELEKKNIVWNDRTVSPERLAERIVGKIQEPPGKPWWFYVTTQTKVLAATLLSALILTLTYYARPIINHFLPSKTSIRFGNATEQAITAHIKNSGPKSSTLVGQRLKFGGLPIEDAQLSLDTTESPTIAPGERDMQLTAFGLLGKCDANGHRPNKLEIVSLLGTQTVTLEIDVRESDDAPGRSTTQTVPIPATQLKPFVRKLVPSRVPPC